MAIGSNGRSPQRRVRPIPSSSPTFPSRLSLSPDYDVRRNGRISFAKCRQAAVLFLLGVVSALALLGYGTILTGVGTDGSVGKLSRPGKGGAGAIYGSRGGFGASWQRDIAAAAGDLGNDQNNDQSRIDAPHFQALKPNLSLIDDDEVPAKPDDLMEIGRKAQKAKDPLIGEKPRKSEIARQADIPKAGATTPTGESEHQTCLFRKYPPHRYYGLSMPLADQPDFLAKAEYIRGTLPIILGSGENSATDLSSSIVKICIDSSSWDPLQKGRRPFSDGQNPSIASLAPDPYSVGSSRTAGNREVRLDPVTVSPLGDIYGHDKLNEIYLGVSLVGNSQCKWKMSPGMAKEYGFSSLDEAPDRRTLILVLDDQLKRIGQATLMIERDAVWGKGRKALRTQAAKGGGEGFERSIEFFDDPRLFFHNGRPFVLYRQGPRFGYEDQVHNPLHFDVVMNADGSRSFTAFVKASETFTVCCGRNISLISDREKPSENSSVGESVLRALTWVDPVTVVEVDMRKVTRYQEKVGRRLLSQRNGDEGIRRQLRSGGRTKGRKSNIHGTNGYMVPLESSSELLGIAHFHRPEDRVTSDYALHGHHYTHALFTIARVDLAGENGNDGKAKYRLRRLSNEFVFESMVPDSDAGEEAGGQARAIHLRRIPDADIIQFASGLDLIGSDTEGRLLISYGINDCEGAAFFMNMRDVQKLLVDVPEGSEVVDLMSAPKVTR